MSRVQSLLALAMVFVLGAAVAAAAEGQQRGPRMFGLRGSFLGMIRVEEVQKELKLNEEQTAKVKEIAEKIREETRAQYAGLREMEDREKRRAKMAELAEQSDEKAHQQLREVLSREQMIRLYQIRLQLRGPVYGLNHEFVAERLKLTDEQKKKAADIQKTSQQKTSEILGSMRGLSAEARREKMAGPGLRDFRQIRKAVRR